MSLFPDVSNQRSKRDTQDGNVSGNHTVIGILNTRQFETDGLIHSNFPSGTMHIRENKFTNDVFTGWLVIALVGIEVYVADESAVSEANGAFDVGMDGVYKLCVAGV